MKHPFFRPNTQIGRRTLVSGIGATLLGSMIASSGVAATEREELEIKSVRILYDPEIPVLCYGPMLLAEDFLRLEGFEEVTYVGYGNAVSDAQVLQENRADFAAVLGSDVIATIDRGAPILILSGLHAGCVELFASNRVKDIRDLGGKRICATGENGPEHVFISSILAFVGLDPSRDVEWVWEADYGKWPELLEQDRVDVVNAFPPQNLVLHDRGIGHVILNTTIDEPWRNFFCCMVAAHREYTQENPVATRKFLRAVIKANQLCEIDQENAARRLVALGATEQYEHARKTLRDVPYGSWREFDPGDTIRFFALRLREAGLIGQGPTAILEKGSDFSFLEQIRRELKT